MSSKIVGHEAIEAIMHGLLPNAPDFHFTTIKILLGSATEVTAEYESKAVLANGKTNKQLYICHLVSKDGMIVSRREFLNTIAFVSAFFPNGLNDLINTK